MKYDLFSIPLLIDDIDCSKVNIDVEGSLISFGSELNTTFDLVNKVDQNSLDYIYKIIVKNLNEVISVPYIAKPGNIWKNYYKQNDFQEKHIHGGSDFSYIIYDSLNSNTVFVHPAHYLIKEKYGDKDIFQTEFSIDDKLSKIIIFPSFLEHYVTKQKSSGTTISGNLKITLEGNK